jgi:TrmH family RNA methyltransferase
MKEISDTASPQGLIAEAKRRWTKLSELVSSRKHLIVAWDVQDPGNVGTIIRSCAAFGMGGFVAGGKSADPFSSKAVRASAGAVLRFPVSRAARLEELAASLKKAGYATFWTGASGEVLLKRIARGTRLAVFTGSEGKGFSARDRALLGEGIRIEIERGVESINAAVASSIIAYELSR